MPAPDAALRKTLTSVARRITLYRASRLLSRAVLLASIASFFLLVAARFVVLPHAVHGAVLLLACGALLGIIKSVRLRAGLLEAAILADRRFRLHEMLPTALEAGENCPLGPALLQRASEKAATLRPARLASFPFPWEVMALLLVAVALASLSALTPSKTHPPTPTAVRNARIGAEARQVRRTAEEIESRFPDEGSEVARKLREVARRLTDEGGNFTETGRAVARLAAEADQEAGRLDRSEEALSRLLEEGETLENASEKDRARASDAVRRTLKDLSTDSRLSEAGARAVEEAGRALERGDRPRFHETLAGIRDDLERVRAARKALEAASLRLSATWEKLRWAFEDDPERFPSPPPPSPRAPAPRLASFEKALLDPRWDPAYDDAVKRYFASLGSPGETGTRTSESD